MESRRGMIQRRLQSSAASVLCQLSCFFEQNYNICKSFFFFFFPHWALSWWVALGFSQSRWELWWLAAFIYFFFSPVINRAIFSELDPRYHKLQPENDTLISLCVLNAGVLQRESAPPLGLCPAVPLLQSFLGKTTSFWTWDLCEEKKPPNFLISALSKLWFIYKYLFSICFCALCTALTVGTQTASSASCFNLLHIFVQEGTLRLFTLQSL